MPWRFRSAAAHEDADIVETGAVEEALGGLGFRQTHFQVEVAHRVAGPSEAAVELAGERVVRMRPSALQDAPVGAAPYEVSLQPPEGDLSYEIKLESKQGAREIT